MTYNVTYNVDALEVINGTYYHTDDIKHMLRTVVEAIVRGGSRSNHKVEFIDYNKQLHIRFATGDVKATVSDEHLAEEDGSRKWRYKLVVALSKRNKLHSSALALIASTHADEQYVPEDLVLRLCVEFAQRITRNRAIFNHGKSSYSITDDDVRSFLKDHMPVTPTVRILAKAEPDNRKAARKVMIEQRLNRSMGRKNYLTARSERLSLELKELDEQIDKLTKRIEGDSKELADMNLD